MDSTKDEALDLNQQVAHRLRKIRLEKGITHEKVHFGTGFTISDYENGRKHPSIRTLSKIITYYGVTLEEFFKGIKS